jgi:DMSO reductase family type II enzyme chaperone
MFTLLTVNLASCAEVLFVLAAALSRVSAQTTATSGHAGTLDPVGKGVYDPHCAACHGVTGDGNGPAAVWLYPKPCNFSDGQFKIQSTPAGSLPTDSDLLQTITRGLAGSSMPAFNYLSEAQRRDGVLYVKHLTAYTNDQGQRINRFEDARRKGPLAAPVQVLSEPAATLQTLSLGKEMYLKMQCNNCHGETGAGDGPQVPTLKDHWGLPIRPRDFNTGGFRGGSTGRDLYLRIHNGLAGTPMVPYGADVMTPDQRWALVHYVQSLRRTDAAVNDLLIPEDGSIRVQRAAKLPVDPMDPFWESLDPVRVPLNPLWPEPQQVYAVAVSAVTDGKKLAVLLQWRDELPQNTARQDACPTFEPGAFPSFLDAYLAAFGHAARGSCPLNEIEYGDIKADGLFQPHRLADLAAFYRAFGLELADDAAERHDHLGVELEFMAVLAAKEAHALEHHLDAGKLGLCQDTQKKFLREHLGRWVPAFARRLANHATGTALAALAGLLGAFVDAECGRYGIVPGSEDLLLRLADEAAESLCGSCGINDLLPRAMAKT